MIINLKNLPFNIHVDEHEEAFNAALLCQCIDYARFELKKKNIEVSKTIVSKDFYIELTQTLRRILIFPEGTVNTSSINSGYIIFAGTKLSFSEGLEDTEIVIS